MGNTPREKHEISTTKATDEQNVLWTPYFWSGSHLSALAVSLFTRSLVLSLLRRCDSTLMVSRWQLLVYIVRNFLQRDLKKRLSSLGTKQLPSVMTTFLCSSLSDRYHIVNQALLLHGNCKCKESNKSKKLAICRGHDDPFSRPLFSHCPAIWRTKPSIFKTNVLLFLRSNFEFQRGFRLSTSVTVSSQATKYPTTLAARGG